MGRLGAWGVSQKTCQVAFFEALEEEAEKSFLAPYSGTISAFAVKQRSLHFPQGVFEKARHQSRMWNIKNIKIKNEEGIYLLKN